MVTIRSKVSLTILVVLTYWSFFLGAELISTLCLYLEGDANYKELKITHADVNNTDRQSVPLVMHRMWKDDHIIERNDSAIPANWTKTFDYCIEQYRQRNWTTTLWTDDSIHAFLKKNYPTFLPTYESYPYDIQRADAARYFILYHHGGLYMDLDVGCKKRKDLTDLIHSMDQLGKVAMIPQTRPVGLSNDVLFATRKSPFFKELIDALPGKNKWYGVPYLTVLYSTGSMFLSLQYTRQSYAWRKDVLVLPPKLYAERETRYFKHLRGSTWHKSDARAIKWLVRNWSAGVVVLFLALVVSQKMKRNPQKQENKIV